METSMEAKKMPMPAPKTPPAMKRNNGGPERLVHHSYQPPTNDMAARMPQLSITALIDSSVGLNKLLPPSSPLSP
jgi:hypothetical protein